MRSLPKAIGSLIALAMMTIAASSSQQKVDVSTRAVVAAATKYVVDYETKFKFVIADETYTQALYDRDRQQTGARRMKGELFLTFIPADAAWLAVHDFAEVDGTAVPDREDLRLLLQKGETLSVVRTVLGRNARFNLGTIVRNFNEPTLALLMLEPKRVNSVSFNREEVQRIGGRTLVRLSFRERERPSLVRTDRGRPVFARGEFTIDAETGRVERSVIEFVDGAILARLTTTYALDEKVEMWVPVAFAERYERTNNDRELILCEADYTNYRRFEVTARIK
ncbi:MAG TPA: hypothetical protein VH679_12850 [Vicinamibacterales bacterium]|jgi:hypothetical protein